MGISPEDRIRQLREAIRRLALLHDRITLDHVECELRSMRAEASRAPRPLYLSERDATVDGNTVRSSTEDGFVDVPRS